MTLDEQIKALNLAPMTDDELMKYCGLSPSQWEKYKPTMTTDDVAFCHQARGVELLCPLWESGVEPYPSDVNVNRGRAKKRKRTPRRGQSPSSSSHTTPGRGE